jgi:hypothetical protein
VLILDDDDDAKECGQRAAARWVGQLAKSLFQGGGWSAGSDEEWTGPCRKQASKQLIACSPEFRAPALVLADPCLAWLGGRLLSTSDRTGQTDKLGTPRQNEEGGQVKFIRIQRPSQSAHQVIHRWSVSLECAASSAEWHQGSIYKMHDTEGTRTRESTKRNKRKVTHCTS